MSLTPEEREELLRRKAQLLQLKQRQEGVRTIDTASDAARQPRRTRDFSMQRVIVGGLRDAGEGVMDTIDGIGDWLGEKTGVGGLVFGSDADNGVVQYLDFAEFNQRGGDALFGEAGGQTEFFRDLEGSEDAGGLEAGLRGIVSFAAPFAGAFKVARGLQAYGAVGALSRGVVAGAAADFTQIDPYEGNMANVLKSFGLTAPVLDDLVSEEDDSVLEARLKSAASGTIAGLGMDAVIGAGSRVARLYRDWRGTKETVQAVIDNAKAGAIKLDVPAPRQADAGVPLVDADEVINPRPDAAGEHIGDFKLVPDTGEPEDILEFLQSKAGDLEMSDEAFEAFAKNLADGDPENALARIGIDPLKMDFSKLEDPEMFGRFTAGLTEVYTKIANRLGRTGTRITRFQLIRTAHSMASDPNVLKSLYGATENLGETLMASRLFVGTHAINLVDKAKLALRELEETGAASEAWAEYLAAFHRHAYFLGALRGAGSEVARALQSLRTIPKVSINKARRTLNEAVSADAAAKPTLLEDLRGYGDSFTTPAEQMEALRQLIGSGGDLEAMNRSVRAGNLFSSKRISQAVKEMSGSLWSAATGMANTVAGGSFLALNIIGKFTSAVARSPFLLSAGPRGIEARRAAYETMFYTEGVLGGFREAFSNTYKVLQREGLSEFSIASDALGFERLAAQAAKKAGEVNREITGHFERADLVTSKAFALSATDRKKLEEIGARLGGPQFFQAGLKGLARLVATTVNATGTGFRVGTSLFINAPDELIGTLAKRAGAYSQAVRIAAVEAADHGLSGKEAGEFMRARTVQLFGDGPRGWADDAFTSGQQETIARAGETEARMVLFQDDLEGKVNRVIQRSHSQVDRHAVGLATLIVPIIKTPLRILERTARDFTPWGLARSRVRNAILHGTPAERDEALARMSIGIIALTTAYQLADQDEGRRIIGYDGGYTSTARDAGRASYTLKVGDDYYEFNRLDPLGTLLGIGADMREYMDAVGDDPDASNLAAEATEGFLWSLTTNILSKTWMTSISMLTDLAGARSDEEFSTMKDQFFKNSAGRLVPAAGIQKSLQGWQDSSLREAADFFDGARKATLGAGELPVKRNFMGREMEKQLVEQVAGLKFSIRQTDEVDPVMAEFERLSMREPTSARTQRGVKLNAQQFSRFLELRGQVVRDPQTGLTMEETMQKLVVHPRYQALPKAARVQAIREALNGFTGLAADTLTAEDETFALAQLRNEVFELSAIKGLSEDQRGTFLESAESLYRRRREQQQ